MCGRVSITTPLEQIAHLVRARGPLPAWRARYNYPPGESIANVIESNGIRRIENYVWGLLASDKRHAYVNVKAETLPNRRAFADRRSLVFVEGFYEWDKAKNPYYVRARDHTPMALAAIYDRSPEQVRCAVITTKPNEAIAEVHHRMPVIVPHEAWKAWLDTRYPDYEELQAMVRPLPSNLLEIYPVSKMVNSPKNDGPELLCPIADMPHVEALKQKVRCLLEPQNEMTAIGMAQALDISEEKAHQVLQALGREVDQRGGRYFLTRWKR